MKKFLALLLLLVAASAMRSQVISIGFANMVPPCNYDGSIDAVVTGGTPPYVYEWSSYTQPGFVQTGATLSNVGGGYYSITVTDANGVTSESATYLPPPFQAYPINITPAHCPANNDGSVTYMVSGGTAPYNYVWSSGQTFLAQAEDTSGLTGLPPGEYSITITDANGCVFSYSDSAAIVSSQADFIVSISSTPANCNDATITANVSGNGLPPYTYYWASTPAQTGQTISGLAGNMYVPVTVTDANGCVANAYGYTNYGPGALNVIAYPYASVCPANNGYINVTVSNGNPPYSYTWSNGAITQDVTGLVPGVYTLTVTDNLGCTMEIVRAVGETSNISAYVSTTATDCSNASGSATVNVSGGTAPYTYHWINGATTATISNLSTGYYGVSVTDANGCNNNNAAYGLVTIPFACMSGVSGYVYNDMNGNCAVDGIETALPWQVIDLGNNYWTSSDYWGMYSYYSVTAGPTYTISHTPMSGWNLICPSADYTVTPGVGQVIAGNDFYDQPVSLQNDVSCYINGSLARPGFYHSKYATVVNHGTTTMSGTISVTHDPLETFVGGNNVISYDPLTRTVVCSYSNLGAFSGTYSTLNFHLPASVPIGTDLITTCMVDPVSGDQTPSDNYDTSVVRVVGSYDPNMKEVSPQGTGAAGLIAPSDQPMKYTVHFQNTGTYLAETVVITDTLNADLDITTFELAGASHNVTWQINGPRVVTFTFNNIHLPDSLSNEPGSHGLVSYTIKQKPNLPAGTEIKNTAYIYFDYNAPIVTNTTLNTIEIVGIKENQFNSGIVISPNPAQDRISISNKNNELCSKVQILDINGKVVASIIPSGESIQLPELASGVYILNAHYKSGVYKEKLLISK